MPFPPGIVASADSPIPATAGIGLRFAHHRAMIDQRPRIGWLEVHAENYMGGGRPLEYLMSLRGDYPISLHGIGLSLGSAGGIDRTHLRRLRDLIERIGPGLVSEHLAWSISGGTYLADLLPLPMTEEALSLVCRHVDEVQAHLQRAILLENPSSYLRYRHSTIPEWEFLAAVSARTGCGILCDVNNIYVSACNHGFDPLAYLDALPADRIGEIHLAGHTEKMLASGRVLRIDDHGSPVPQAVWALYEAALARLGRAPTLIEWDTDVPPLEILLDEAAEAARRMAAVTKDPPNAAAA